MYVHSSCTSMRSTAALVIVLVSNHSQVLPLEVIYYKVVEISWVGSLGIIIVRQSVVGCLELLFIFQW